MLITHGRALLVLHFNSSFENITGTSIVFVVYMECDCSRQIWILVEKTYDASSCSICYVLHSKAVSVSGSHLAS